MIHFFFVIPQPCLLPVS
uniref:Uncharacterized protein n=1 Tax=Rhizophora mucronata TaxID=61149 RepID=A0A2P2PF01_RHIMU